jgi:hypothetical protein
MTFSPCRGEIPSMSERTIKEDQIMRTDKLSSWISLVRTLLLTCFLVAFGSATNATADPLVILFVDDTTPDASTAGDVASAELVFDSSTGAYTVTVMAEAGSTQFNGNLRFNLNMVNDRAGPVFFIHKIFNAVPPGTPELTFSGTESDLIGWIAGDTVTTGCVGFQSGLIDLDNNSRDLLCTSSTITIEPVVRPFDDFNITDALAFFNFPNQDFFLLEGEFTLGSATDGIDPPNELVEIQFGTALVSIPSGHWRAEGGRFRVDAFISGIFISGVIVHESGDTFEFVISAVIVEDLPGISEDVDIGLTIGNDSGSTNITMEGEMELFRP